MLHLQGLAPADRLLGAAVEGEAEGHGGGSASAQASAGLAYVYSYKGAATDGHLLY